MIQGTRASILCALCGIKFQPDNANICNACTLSSIVEQKILSGDQILYCRFCERFERPPWINCERQSKQMLQILLKKVKGLNKVTLVDAKFLWTQPHSKRMKIKIVFNKQINANMKLQQTQVIQFVQVYTQCLDCKKQFTPHDWNTAVQIRQHVNHKKSILALQQIILKRNFNDKMLKVQEVDTGMDCFFKNINTAHKFVDFIKASYPVSIKISKQLVSHNERDNTSNVKTTISVIISKICRDDLVRIPRKLSKQLGSCSQLLLCVKVTSMLHFVDIVNFKKVQISSTQYFLYEDKMIIYPLKLWSRQFNVLDCQQTKVVESHLQHPIYNFSIMRPDQYKQVFARCHFPDECGNDIIGYDLTANEDFQNIKDVPDIVLVKKCKNKNQNVKKDKKQSKKKQQKVKGQADKKILKQKKEHKQDSDDDYDEQDYQSMDEDQQQNIKNLQENMASLKVQQDKHANSIENVD